MKNRKYPSQERLKELYHYDPETGFFTWRKNHWCAKAGSLAGSVKKRGYLTMSVDGSVFYGHRLAWVYCFGVVPHDQIDHINGVRTDNRIQNLRVVSDSENRYNTALNTTNTSNYKGVSWVPKRNRWVAYVSFKKRKVFNRYYRTAEEAAAAVRAAREKFHGEFARHE